MKIETPPVPRQTTLSGRTIVFLSLPKHDGPYTSTPWQLAVRFATQNRVVFCDHPSTFADLVTGFFKKGILTRLRAMFNGAPLRKEGVEIVLPPFVLPVNFLPAGKWYKLLSGWNTRLIARRLNKYFRKNGIESIIYINSFDFYYPDLFKYLKPGVLLNIYHCIDPMVKAFTLRHGARLQQQAARQADMIVVTAPALARQFSSAGFPKTYLVPNAANFELFNRACYEPSIHPSVASIEGKVMGYLGNIERRIDFKLLLRVLDILTDWHLVLAGPVERQYVPGEIFKHSRIHFTGPIAHHDAPSLIRRFDVSLIPFACDEVSSGIYPLKLFEYMAAGKPVVSTNFNPEILSQLGEVVHTADHAEQFADFILLAYATDSRQKREKRISVAAQNTWEQRAQLFSGYLLQELEVKDRHRYVA